MAGIRTGVPLGATAAFATAAFATAAVLAATLAVPAVPAVGAVGAVPAVGAVGAVPAVGAGGASVAATAFPGAVGFGAGATGGTGGSTYHVTNLNDSGTGSFRDAVSGSGRIVVFDVGGYINLSSPVSVSSNITIEGNTAPEKGIGVMGREVSFSGSGNDIVEYVRFRQGTLDSDTGKPSINLFDASDMIFDHISVEFGQWDNINAVGASDITIQDSIIADPIGQQFGSHTETGPFTWYHDLFANSHNRNPLAKADTQFIDNVVYDYQGRYTAGNSSGVFTHDVVHNYFIAGPATTSASDAYYQMSHQEVYNSGNLLDSNKNGTLDGSTPARPRGRRHGAELALGLDHRLAFRPERVKRLLLGPGQRGRPAARPGRHARHRRCQFPGHPAIYGAARPRPASVTTATARSPVNWGPARSRRLTWVGRDRGRRAGRRAGAVSHRMNVTFTPL